MPAISFPASEATTKEQSSSLGLAPSRRSATLYDPRDASLFKLSRLRVPRYRQVFSTLSFATMLGLFVAVLVDRSLEITPLEVLFWLWSAAYMLDEVVGFTEQGFGLYIMSFWNAFDLGILALFAVYYCLRLYGVVLAESGKHHIAALAYDVLASTAILLFPRLFGVLDHYRYFSQLLIAFRMMAQDLIAILILILIFCSGFFVAFTLSFADENQDANGVAYALFQIVMGFTPAAWDHWAGYNILGKAIMAIFLIICHFLIVTILITVLTNSFMAIVKNAEEEHQFLFAINTISMVKSDALFSYVAPTNIIGWVLSPLRFVMPLRHYVKFNRTIIKITHSPILFVIFLYERLIMARNVYVPTDLVEQHPVKQKVPVAFSINRVPEIFSPGYRMREASVIGFRKDQALEEVFRRPFQGDTIRTTTQNVHSDRGGSKNVVDNWMQAAENEGGASPPLEQPRSVVERLEHRRPNWKRAATADRLRSINKAWRGISLGTRSAASDPDRLSVRSIRKRPEKVLEEPESLNESRDAPPQETDADADVDDYNDEHNDESDAPTPADGGSASSLHEPVNRTPTKHSDLEFYHASISSRSPLIQSSHKADVRLREFAQDVRAPSFSQGIQGRSQKGHQRKTSSGTVLYAPPPQFAHDSNSTASYSRSGQPAALKTDMTHPSSRSPTLPDPIVASNTQRQTKNRPPLNLPGKSRPILAPRQKTMPSDSKLPQTHHAPSNRVREMPVLLRRDPSFSTRALDLASEIGDNKISGEQYNYTGGISGMPSSFTEQLFRERELKRRAEEEQRRSEEEEKGMVNRIMLARMHTLEEGFREVLREIKDMSSAKGEGGSSRRDSEIESFIGAGPSVRIGARSRMDAPGTIVEPISSGSGVATPRSAVGKIRGGPKLGSPRKSATAGTATTSAIAAIRRNSKKDRGPMYQPRVQEDEATPAAEDMKGLLEQQTEAATRAPSFVQDEPQTGDVLPRTEFVHETGDDAPSGRERGQEEREVGGR